MKNMTQKHAHHSFEEFFWKDIDLKSKVILDAGTGFGITTTEIAKRVRRQKSDSIMLSIDIDPQAFSLARRFLRTQNLLRKHSLLGIIAFICADLSHLPIKGEAIDIIVCTRTLADVENFPCRVIRAIDEFYKALKKGGKIVMSDEYPILSPSSDEEKVAVMRWQLVKALSHLIGRPHAHEIFPEDLEFVMRLVGFRECKWGIFKGEEIPKRRINHFVEKSTEMCTRIANPRLKQSFITAIQEVKKLFKEKGGIFLPRYIFYAVK